MKRLPKLVASAVALAALTGLLASCSSGGSASPNGDASNILKVGKLLPLTSVDPQKVNDGMSNEVITSVYDGLFTLGRDAKLEPLMAKSYTTSDDGLTYTFTLRDAKWSNGTPVTAKDFEFSWKRLVDPETAAPNSNEAVAAGIKNADEIVNGGADPDELGVTALDDHTLQVQLAAKVPYFLPLLVRPAFEPVNQAYYEKVGDKYGQTPETTIYNGPFVWKSWDYANNFSVRKNPDYWNKSGIQLGGVDWRVVKDSQTGSLLEQSGDLDWTEISGSLIDKYQDSKDFSTTLAVHMWWVYPNMKNTILQNKDIRTALATSYDKEALADEVLKNGSQAADYFVGKNLATGPDGEQFRATGGEYLEYDEQAAQAAWKKGLQEIGKSSVTLNLDYWDDDSSVAQAEYLATQWEKNLPGLTVKLTSAPRATQDAKAQKGDFDLYLFRWGPDYKDPMAFLELLATGDQHDYGSYDDSAYNSIIAAARTPEMLDQPEKRWESLHQAEELIMGDVGVFPTVQNGLAALVNPSVKGMDITNVGTTWNYRDVTKNK